MYQEQGRHVHDIDYDMDASGKLVYWDVLARGYAMLLPGDTIGDPHVCIGKIGQQNLLPPHMSLKDRDFEETIVTDIHGCQVADPVPPGLSAFLFWGTKASYQQDAVSVSATYIGREATKKNRLYVTQVDHILRAGWTPYFAPLIGGSSAHRNPLHVLLVPNSLLYSGQWQDATFQEKEQLVNAFISWP